MGPAQPLAAHIAPGTWAKHLDCVRQVKPLVRQLEWSEWHPPCSLSHCTMLESVEVPTILHLAFRCCTLHCCLQLHPFPFELACFQLPKKISACFPCPIQAQGLSLRLTSDPSGSAHQVVHLTLIEMVSCHRDLLPLWGNLAQSKVPSSLFLDSQT